MATRNSENSYITIGAANEINYPVQPSFMAYLGAQVADVTGDATAYTVLCDQVVWDQAPTPSYTAATGIFAAPVAGRYHFSCGITMSSIGATTIYFMSLVTTGGTYSLFQCSPSVIAVGGVLTVTGSAYVNMAAGNTAKLVITCSGTTKTVDIEGQATDPITWFSGMLAC